MSVLYVPSFGSGVVLEGASDVRRTDELAECDGYDIGERGQLVAASDLSDWVNLDNGAGTTYSRIYAVIPVGTPQAPLFFVVGDLTTNRTLIAGYDATTGAHISSTDLGPNLSAGIIVTAASFPVVLSTGDQARLVLIAIAARETANPVDAYGLVAVTFTPPGPGYGVQYINNYDALGTGSRSEDVVGTKGKKLYPRGILAYNNHALAYGFDNHTTTGDGPNRLMFSNTGKPLKWGLDPGPVGTDRDFTDSDAFTIGGGEIIRAGHEWAGKAWLGTNTGLRYVEGFGRESFLTNGSLSVRQTLSVIGQHCLIEGPDGLLYGVCPEGLWAFNGGDTIHLYRRLRDYASKSPGWWDLIWTDTSRAAGYPGKTNQDLVWMLADPETMQVWVVIPFCNATAGYGYGTDSVIIKYHTATGGFTQQKFAGKTLSAGNIVARSPLTARARLVADPGTATNLKRYAHKANPSSSPAIPSTLPVVTFGEYAPFGPTGSGVERKGHLTLSWESAAALPLVFTVTPTVDGEALAAVTLTIGASAPVGPSTGDVWVDTSGTDTNLGNGTAGTIVPAHAADYLLKRYMATWAKWVIVGGGQQGTRITVPIAFTAQRGARILIRCACTAASGRWQIEGLGQQPVALQEAT